MLNNNPKIYDQYTDRSGSVLIKIASNIVGDKVQRQAVEVLYNLPDRLTKKASRAYFNSDTPEDTFLSRIYFEGQKHLMKTADAQAIDATLCKAEALHSVSRPLFKKTADNTPVAPGVGRPLVKGERYYGHVPPNWKMRKAKLNIGNNQYVDSVEVLPGLFVHPPVGMDKAAEAFSEQYQNLNFADRKKYALNFAKAAGVNALNEDLCLYASINTELRPDAKEQLSYRKAACLRSGKDGSDYEKIASMLDQVDTTKLSDGELAKLADTVHTIDAKHGFTDPKYDHMMPDAWHAMLKKADDRTSTNNDSGLSDKPQTALTKSDILARYGEQAVDAVENEDGSINSDRLKKILMLTGDAFDSKNDNK